jgi:hypothetical protein
VVSPVEDSFKCSGAKKLFKRGCARNPGLRGVLSACIDVLPRPALMPVGGG